MKLNKLLFNNKDYILEGDIDFSSEEFDGFHIRKINVAHVKITGQNYDDLLVLNLNIEVEVIGVCAYTLEDVPLKLKIKENIEFSDTVEDDDTIFFEKNIIFDIDPYILSVIVANVPNKIVKKGAKLPDSGNGYRVLSEEDYNEEQKNKTDSRWSALDELDIK